MMLTGNGGLQCVLFPRIVFEGHADELLAADAPYLKEFLYNTLPAW